MRHLIDTALLKVIGWANLAVFKVSRGGVRFYSFGGVPGLFLTVTAPAAPIGEDLSVSCFPDGDDHIVLAAASDTRLLDLLRTATAVTFSDSEIPVDCVMLTDTERAVQLRRIRKRLSLPQRHEVTEHRLLPVARLSPRL
ncbi:hypothetical protein [Nonomuraea longicatena]|uniref:Uncharacterized protein n=1 Tax=Nonomuraea longicatena TaxID=83682 RepID=A0ABP4ABJ7_9ACTN